MNDAARFHEAYQKCVHLRDRSESLITRSHKLMVESEVLSCSLRLLLRQITIRLTPAAKMSKKRIRIYSNAIAKLRRYDER